MVSARAMGRVQWVGLPGAGKSTVARRLLKRWADEGAQLTPLPSPWAAVGGGLRGRAWLLRLLTRNAHQIMGLSRFAVEAKVGAAGPLRAFLERAEWHRKLPVSAFTDESIAQSLLSLCLGGSVPSVNAMAGLLGDLNHRDTLILLDVPEPVLLQRLAGRDGPSRLDRLPAAQRAEWVKGLRGFLPTVAIAAQAAGARCLWLDGRQTPAALCDQLHAALPAGRVIGVRVQGWGSADA